MSADNYDSKLIKNNKIIIIVIFQTSDQIVFGKKKYSYNVEHMRLVKMVKMDSLISNLSNYTWLKKLLKNLRGVKKKFQICLQNLSLQNVKLKKGKKF